MSTCQSCSAELPAGARFCGQCGSPQSERCSACGAALPEEAKFCLQCGAPRASAVRAEPAQPVPTSARRVTSVLFGDLVGFTTLSESRDQEEVREILSRYFEECRVIIDRYGGTVEKFIGDAVMAVWGVPLAHEDDAERAVRAGLELVDAVTVLGEGVSVPGMAMRVGIVTGEVAVSVGARGQGLVAGDPVNTAARIQTAASPGTVWVDETTRHLTLAAVSYTDVGVHALKGKENPVDLWQATAVIATVGGDQRADGLEAPLVGRDRELRLVKEVFHSTEQSRTPTLLLVSAEPGLGKTRLGWEFSKYTDGLSEEIRWMEGRCPAYGDASFHALAEAFRGRLRALDDGGGTPLGDLLDQLLQTWVPDADERPWLRARMATLLALPGASAYPREELFAAWLTVLERMSSGASSVVLLIDDAQYADDGLLDFLEFALTTSDLPLLVVLLTRPELLADRPGLTANPNVVTVHLRELTPAEMTSVVSALVAGLPGSVTTALVERAEGVPLFAVETVRSLIDQGAVQAEPGGRHVLADRSLDVDSLAAPVSLQALIASRLDTLPADLRATVDLASVLGSSFRPEVLVRLLDRRPDPELASLVQRQVFRQDTNPLSGQYGSYSFAQDVVRQVAYSMLGRRGREATHLRVVDILEDDSSEAALPVIAHHLAAAVEAHTGAGTDELSERAITAFEAAGDWAMKVGSWTDADTLYSRGVELADDPARQARLLCRITEVHNSSYQLARGLETGRRAIRLAEQAGDEVTAAKAAGLTAFLLRDNGEVGEALSLIEPYWETLRDRTDADDALRWVAYATSFVRTEASPAHEAGEQPAKTLLTVAQRSGDPTDLLRGLNMLQHSYGAQGLTDSARAICTGALEIARTHGLKEREAILLGNLAELEQTINLDDALATMRQVAARFRELHSVYGTAIQDANLQKVLFQIGRWRERDEALAAGSQLAPTLQRHVESFSALVGHARGQEVRPFALDDLPDDPEVGLQCRAANVLTRALDGDTAGLAEEVLEHVRTALSQLGGVLNNEDFLVVPGEVLVRLGDADALATVLEESSTRPEASLPLPLRAGRVRLRAHLARLRSGPTTAVADSLREAVRLYEGCHYHLLTHRTQHDLADVLDALGNHEEADGLRATVRTFYEELGATAWLRDLDRTDVAR